MNIFTGSFEVRMRESISLAWKIFMEKVGSGMLRINKEASMQLQYACILQQIIPWFYFSEDESVKIELEADVKISGIHREIDLVVLGSNKSKKYNIAVEMKCYRKLSSSGKPRNAYNIFMKNVYKDLWLLESYCSFAGFNQGVALVMNDYEHIVKPKKEKKGACWNYDISDGTKVDNFHWPTPIAGKSMTLMINKSYEFKWVKKNNFWFLEIEGA